jgi:hypothetical protein
MRGVSHGLHVLGEVAVGVLALVAVGALVLGWRLGQGPIDVTQLLRGHASFEAGGVQVHIGQAALAWEGFGHAERPLDVVVRDVTADAADGSVQARIERAHVGLALTQLIVGRLAPTSVDVDGAALTLRRQKQTVSAARLPAGGEVAFGKLPPWLSKLRAVRVRATTVRAQGLLQTGDLVAQLDALNLASPDGVAVALELRVTLAMNGAQTALELRGSVRPDGSDLTLSSSPLSPAALARLSPALNALGALDAPVGLKASARLGPDFAPLSGRLEVTVGAGIVHAGRGSVALAGMSATVEATPMAARLDGVRIAFAAAAGGTGAPPPVVTASASATRTGDKLHAAFSVAIDSAQLADLGRYWPAGTGGGGREWLVQNVTAGRAHDARVAGALDGPWPANGDMSDMELTALSGGLLADDVSLTWLKPVPGLVHGHVRVVVEGPDSLTVTMDKGGQSRLVLAPDSRIRITKLEEKHQFGDIDVGLSGPLADALALLNHPRLHLLSRSGLAIEGAAGDVNARLKLHVPLEDKVTIDDIPISARATLHGVHLGAIAAGHDLDHGELTLDVTNDGLKAGGTGDLSAIPVRLALEMDFRDGAPGQVLQHAHADGTATAAQMAQAGVPGEVGKLLTAGLAGLAVDYAALRGGEAELQVDADLTQAAVETPIGWSKKIGPRAAIGGRVMLTDGHLVGVDRLHAEGPGLALVSRAELSRGQRVLVLDKVEVGRTRARGRLAFPEGGAIRADLTGQMLDLSPWLDPAAPKKDAEAPPAEDVPEKRGLPWAARLAFGQVALARGKVLAPFSLDAASDGLKIAHAQVRAGAAGQFSADVTPRTGGRDVHVAADDAGLALRALDVADNLSGGRLQLDGAYDDTQPGHPLKGVATLTEFNVRSAPAIGRLLQAMTLYGVTDVLRGPGLHFSRLVAPFEWRARVLHLADARAFSSSLGITAKGYLDLRRHTADVTGTVVPAYFFNQLLGKLPLVGQIFSPEKGGGVFAARYSVRGKLSDPKVGVNPLAALTPGFLREGFGLFLPPATTQK